MQPEDVLRRTGEQERNKFMEHNEKTNQVNYAISNINPQVRAAFLGALIFGLFSQGMGLFNKFSHHDDVANLFSVGTTISSGRWMLQVLAWLEGLLYGTGNTSLPLFNGFISILCIGAVAGLMVSLLKIRNKAYCALLGCIMVAFPVITALFAYMFTSHFYMIGFLMMTFCACLICRKVPWFVKLFAIGLGGAAVGIYQAFLSELLTIILFYDIMLLVDENEDKYIGAFIKRVCTQLFCLIGVMIIYTAGNQFFLNKYQVELSSYQGLDQMGHITIQTLLDRLGRAYAEFFNPTQHVFRDMYPGMLHMMYLLTLVIEIFLTLRIIILTGRRSKGKAVLLAILFALIPLGCNLIYIMAENIHGLMVYGQVMQLVLFVWLFDRLEISSLRRNQTVSFVASLILTVIAVMYARYDNQCYLKDTLHQQEAISYYTTLITRIKSQRGYRPNMEVYLVNTAAPDEPDDPTVYNIDELDFIRLNPYWHNSMEYLHTMTREEFMRTWCGVNFSWGWEAEVRFLPEVQAMPCYPADGSIQIINDAVVVKF